MKDLTHIYDDESFIKTATEFQDKHHQDNDCDKTKNGNSDNKWKVFKDDFLRLSHHKCPICETDIGTFDDIDHYRPKKHYGFMKCNYRNFIILCNICNRTCKGENFPLDSEFKAESIDDISKEEPLLINPCIDNIYDYFCLEFKRSKSEQLLILVPHFDLEENSLAYRKAEATIAFYGLGDCLIGKDLKECLENKRVDNCRREFMKRMYGTFFDLIEALSDYSNGKMKKEAVKKIVDTKKSLNYGFYQFIKNRQFRINEIR